MRKRNVFPGVPRGWGAAHTVRAPKLFAPTGFAPTPGAVSPAPASGAVSSQYQLKPSMNAMLFAPPPL
jgi:hypothetical protein